MRTIFDSAGFPKKKATHEFNEIYRIESNSVEREQLSSNCSNLPVQINSGGFDRKTFKDKKGYQI